ncbi:hypothetical protein CPB84DRAFT_1781627 [Gymnopilus junonius]|uniref:Uncharacterized protein n=1 Tax=Gymnopilus junonius TaxID=109634 RepID=A0A9P5TL89_GYMJU|nr:hypothetical protein CPB84DRAFT_1781627 [Gymnopilus junonius]
MPKTMDFKWECTIDNWVRHAGDLPLSFALSESRACRVNRPSRCSRCRQLQARIFEKYSDRIYHLEGVTSHLFETLSKKSLKNIHSPIFDVPYPIVEASQLWNINPRFSPNFRQLRLAGTKDTYMALGLGTCPRNLTHLTGHVVGRVSRTFFFHVFPNLQGAVVHYSSLAYHNPATLANEETVTLPQLTTLTVFFPKDSAIDLTNFLSLNMPLLITLRLGSFSLRSFALMSFAEKSMKHIYHRLKNVQQLSLIFNYVSGHEFMDLLFHLPDLEKLDIQDSINIGEIVSNFRDLQDRLIIPFLPSLRTITLDINRLIDIDFHSFHVNLPPLL